MKHLFFSLLFFGAGSAQCQGLVEASPPSTYPALSHDSQVKFECAFLGLGRSLTVDGMNFLSLKGEVIETPDGMGGTIYTSKIVTPFSTVFNADFRPIQTPNSNAKEYAFWIGQAKVNGEGSVTELVGSVGSISSDLAPVTYEESYEETLGADSEMPVLRLTKCSLWVEKK